MSQKVPCGFVPFQTTDRDLKTMQITSEETIQSIGREAVGKRKSLTSLRILINLALCTCPHFTSPKFRTLFHPAF